MSSVTESLPLQEVCQNLLIPGIDVEIERRLCERSFYQFIQRAWSIVEPNPYRDNWHVELMADALQAVDEGEVLKLIQNVPPGSTKSLLNSVMWPAWRWTRNPTLRFIYASYSHGLAIRDAVRTRNLIESPWYQERWGDKVTLAGDQNQKTYYETTAGGYRLSTTPGSRSVGEHPETFIADDPHNVLQAESPVERQSVIDWWDLTVTLRGASKRSSRVIVMQRLHDNDLTGHVLKNKDWVHICLSMRYEPDRMTVMPFRRRRCRHTTGEFWQDLRAPGGQLAGQQLLWPDVFTEEKTREFEYTLQSYGTASQLQQRPAPREGGMFKREWFVGKIITANRAPRPNEYESLCRYWDKGGTTDGDPTAGALMGRVKDRFIVPDVTTGQWTAGQRDDNIDLAATMDETEYGGKVHTRFEQEPGSGGKQSAEISLDRLRGLSASIEKPVGSKDIRAEPFAIECERGNVYFVEGPWNRAVIEELCSFPNAAHDDVVDALAGSYRYLARPQKRLMVANVPESAAADSSAGECSTPGCHRLREPGTEYCCATCREAGHTNGVQHSPACCVRWNDHYVKIMQG